MIYFRPAYSGINSMLGQMMWFKLFCDGHRVEFDFALDMDQSPRNRSEKSIHDLFFSAKLKEHLQLPFNEVIGIFDFFKRIESGSLKVGSGNLLVVAGHHSTTLDPGVWRCHEFQLHCLRRGFLADTYPYWLTSLEGWTQHGSLARLGGVVSSKNRDSGRDKPPIGLAHMRLGDCSVLSSRQAADLMGQEVPGDVIAAGHILSEQEYYLYKMGLLPKFAPTHYSERGARLVKMDSFLFAMQAMRNRLEKPSRIVFATDGYTRVAKILAFVLRHDVGQIERKLNRIFDPFLSISDEAHIGERDGDLVQVIRAIAESDALLTTSSLFALTVKCALIGRQALDTWVYLDESDTLSRYFQLPSLVDMPHAAFAAQLERLIAAQKLGHLTS